MMLVFAHLLALDAVMNVAERLVRWVDSLEDWSWRVRVSLEGLDLSEEDLA
jgi:hypothetical protein